MLTGHLISRFGDLHRSACLPDPWICNFILKGNLKFKTCNRKPCSLNGPWKLQYVEKWLNSHTILTKVMKDSGERILMCMQKNTTFFRFYQQKRDFVWNWVIYRLDWCKLMICLIKMYVNFVVLNLTVLFA